MNRPILIASLLAPLLWHFPAPLQAETVTLEDIVALHWHPVTAEQARRNTLALSVWLEDAGAEPGQWRQRLDANVLTLERLAETVPPAQAPAADGMFAWLVQAREQNLPTMPAAVSMPAMHRLGELTANAEAAGRVARLYATAALEAPQYWQRLVERLAEVEDLDVDRDLTDLWAPLQMLRSEVSDDQPHFADHALGQAGRVMALSGLETSSERSLMIARILFEQAVLNQTEGELLRAVWQLFGGLIYLTAATEVAEQAAAYQQQIDTLADSGLSRLRQVDTDLPAILALMSDAAGYLAETDAAVAAAMIELADAYARLALFVSDAAYYLDQPVREDVRAAITQCNPDPLLVGPLPREIFENCLDQLTDLLINELDREELSGGSGPYAPEFLRREMGLVSWQRATYLDGHINWRLQANCESPRWINVLEWSILMQYLAQWVPQRPVFFGSERWQDATETIADIAEQARIAQTTWLDCMTGMGSQRRDPVVRLLQRAEQANNILAGALDEAAQQFYAEVTREGADIDLDAGPEQATNYRPATLVVRPCPEAQSCGARAELPVSRALLGLFPNSYLLADQLDMGRLQLCYGEVRWVDREIRPGRAEDDQVANYHGRLSFELVGSFASGDEESVVFRQQLTAADSRHYLFASSDPSVRELDCPVELIGQSIASRLREGRAGLVPNRLTYFVSTPTTAESELLANWDRGAEWRDWFVTGTQTELLERVDGSSLAVAVEERLAQLVSRRERQLSGRLLSPMTSTDSDPLRLAMADLVEYTALLRRMLEIHYPRVLRHNDAIRGLLGGDEALLNRDRIRQLRDAGVPAARMPVLGRERIERLREHWLALPQNLRENGQHPPELDFAQEQLDTLLWISRYWPSVGAESQAAPKSTP